MNYAQLLLPDFSLILCGYLVCRYTALNRTVWEQVESLVYFFLFPVLLFHSIVRTPLDLQAASQLIMAGLVLGLCSISITYALPKIPFLRQYIDVRLHAASAQVGFRFNSFIALALAERVGLWIDLPVLPFEHDHPKPAQFAHRAQKRAFGVPGVGGDGVKKTGAVNPAQPAQQAQGRRAFLLARTDRFDIQQGIDFGAVDLGKDVTVVILGDFALLAVGSGFLDLTPTAVLAAAAAAGKVFVGVQADKEQPVDFAAFQGLVLLEGFDAAG